MLGLPAPSARLLPDCEKETSRLAWNPEMSRPCLCHTRALADWTRALGLPDVLAASSIALMACRGATYHHDGAHYGAAACCSLFLSEDRGLDLHFPSTGHRIPRP